MRNRDVFLDDVRGCAMIWVILVHSLYWIGLFSNYPIYIIKSFFLIEMPIFFFVTGASCQLSTYKSYRIFVGKRLQRILIPYWIYAAVCLAFIFIYHIGVMQESYNVSQIIECIVSWIIPSDRKSLSVSFLSWALWFIPIYCICIIIIPLLLKMKRGGKGILTLFFLGIIFIVLDFADIYYVQMTAFYLIWIMVGMFYPEIRLAYNRKPKITIKISFCIFILGIVCSIMMHEIMGYSYNMQTNKFPPNMMFLSYSVGTMALLFCLAPRLLNMIEKAKKNILFKNVFEQYINHSLTIFLFHPFIFMILVFITGRYLYILPEVVQLVIFFSIAVISGAILAKMLSWIEKIDVIKF